MAVIKPDDFLKKLQADPQQSVDVIITTKTNPEENVAHVEGMGLTVKRTYSLRPMIAATGPASAVISLASESWVESIEPDQPVHTMS